ncbi:hypothetical protein [Streptomyces showdoensis]|uniref:hypothetical protein n=1 Tax=Streptomyces showdoensis TaxID=68268 RepID=UPI0013F4EFE6|nr:hypothetical protein [Streptomyces showdoensis]
MGQATIQCPECGTSVPIAMRHLSTTSDTDKLMIVVEPDLTDVWAHHWVHESD